MTKETIDEIIVQDSGVDSSSNNSADCSDNSENGHCLYIWSLNSTPKVTF
jgi:hypothetical protein